MSFQFFNGTQVSKSTDPKITVRRGGVLIFNEKAVTMLGDDVTHVQVAYDPDRKAVAIARAEETAAGRYRLRQQKDNSSWLVNAKPMFQHYRLTIEKAKSFDIEEFGSGLIGATLNGSLSTLEEPMEAVPEPKAETAKPKKKA